MFDTVEKLAQMGSWAMDSFDKDRERIELCLKLTRKNLNALSGFPSSRAFDPGFKKFCASFNQLEEEYRTGIVDRKAWANGMIAWGNTLYQNATRALA